MKRERNRSAEMFPDFRILRSPAFLHSSLKSIKRNDLRNKTDGNREMLLVRSFISPG